MKKLTGTLVALAFCGSGFAQTQAESARMSRIFATINLRLSNQVDGWFNDGEFPKAIHCLRLNMDLEPKDYDIATNLGWLLESTEQQAEALAVYQRYAKNNPNDPDRHLPTAQFYFNKRAFSKIPPLLETIVSKDKPHPNCYRLLAHSYDRMNMLTDSKRIWEALIARTGDETAKVNLRRVEDKIKNAAKSGTQKRRASSLR